MDVTITDIAQKGDGIARVEGFIIFVPGASKGETCRIRIRDVRPRFGIADKVGAASGESSGATEETPAEESEEDMGEEQ